MRQPHARRDKPERIKAGIRAKVKHPFPVPKRQVGYVTASDHGLAKNSATVFMLSNL